MSKNEFRNARDIKKWENTDTIEVFLRGGKRTESIMKETIWRIDFILKDW